MVARRWLGWPILLGVTMIVLLIVVTVGWIIVNVLGALQGQNAGAYWALLAVGTTILGLVLVGVVLYLLLSIKAIRLNQRQSNFIDSVTHEFKSPLTSLKLYVQTLTRHQVTEEQRSDFYRFMIDDLVRLDGLVDHLLDAARIDQGSQHDEVEEVELAELLGRCAQTACHQHRRPADTIQFELEPAVVRAPPTDLEIVFRNLLDNALKYSGPQAEVQVQSSLDGYGQVVIRITDNGPGIPAKWRRKVFGRFFRIGSELERSTQGTGLGLYIVRTLVHKLHGKVLIRGRTGRSGTVLEVWLPAVERAQIETVEATRGDQV